MSTIVHTPEGIAYFQLCARKGAIKLEIVGLSRSRGARSAYSISKEVYGLTGSREKVVEQLEEMIKKAENGASVIEMIKSPTERARFRG